MFIHFGVNTFSDDEWSDGTIPATAYNPADLDCDQWVRVARDAGFRYVLLVTKHHDGFCLWDSKYTDAICMGCSLVFIFLFVIDTIRLTMILTLLNTFNS